MPIVIRHNGALNALTEGLSKGFAQGKELQHQQEAIEEAKRRRALEERRVAMAESQASLAQTLAQSEEEFNKSQRAYTQKAQGQAQEDRTRLAGERSAAQEGNARLLGEALQGDPRRQARVGSAAGAAAGGGFLGAPAASGGASVLNAELEDAKATARHMSPDEGAAYVQREQQRIDHQRKEAMRPKLLKAWKDTLERAQNPDPEDPTGGVMANPKIIGRAQAAIAGLESGADPDLFAQQFSTQMQDVQQERAKIRKQTLFRRQVEGRIASAQQEADTTLDEDRAIELSERINEAQSYIDAMEDPSLDEQDVGSLHTKAMAALHGRGTTSRSAKQQKSLYTEAQKLADADVNRLLKTNTGMMMKQEQLDALHQQYVDRHLQALRDEAGQSAAPPARGARGQSSVTPGAAGTPGGDSSGAQDFLPVRGPTPAEEADPLAGAPKTIEEWRLTEPKARDNYLTQIALRDPQAAVQIAAQLGLKGESKMDPKTHKPTGENAEEADKADLIGKIENAGSLDALNNAVRTYQRIYGELPDTLKYPAWAKRE